jgi:hypothetical protein
MRSSALIQNVADTVAYQGRALGLSDNAVDEIVGLRGDNEALICIFPITGAVDHCSNQFSTSASPRWQYFLRARRTQAIQVAGPAIPKSALYFAAVLLTRQMLKHLKQMAYQQV